MEKCEKMWKNVEKCAEMRKNVQKCAKMRKNVQKCEKMWKNVKNRIETHERSNSADKKQRSSLVKTVTFGVSCRLFGIATALAVFEHFPFV